MAPGRSAWRCDQQSGPRHSVERGHGSLRRDVARAASLCERRHHQAGRPARPTSPTSTITAPTISSDGGTKPRLVWVAFPIFIGATAKLPQAICWPVLVRSAAGLVFVTGVWPHHFTGAGPWPAPRAFPGGGGRALPARIAGLAPPGEGLQEKFSRSGRVGPSQLNLASHRVRLVPPGGPA